jgi:hypothetical protein
MSRARFTSSEITRAFKAARAAGVTAEITIDIHGTMRLTPCEIVASTSGGNSVLDRIKRMKL